MECTTTETLNIWGAFYWEELVRKIKVVHNMI